MNSIHTAVRTLLILCRWPVPSAWADTPASQRQTPTTGVAANLAPRYFGAGRLLRSRSAWTRWQWPLLQRLPHGHGTVPADPGRRGEQRSSGLQKRRHYNPNADDPLFRPIDADDFRTNGEQASDYSNLRQNGLIRIVFTLPPNMRLIDPATNHPRMKPLSTSGAWFRASTDREAHRRGWPESLAARSEPHRRLSARRTISHSAGAGTGRAARSRANSEPAATTVARRSDLVSARAVHERTRAGAFRRDRPGRAALAGCRSAAQCAGTAGQDDLHSRLCAMSRRPGQSTAQAPVVRFHDISRNAPGLSIDRQTRPPAPSTSPRARRASRATRGPMRSPTRRHQDPADQLRSGPRPVDGIRGVPGPPAATTGTSWTFPACAGCATPRRTSTTTAPHAGRCR